MKVFISWSGPMSHRVAVALRDWLPAVLQAIEPYVSSEDIDKGARWNTDISKELEDSSFGILCITPENLEAPWLNFEAGALSKSLDRARVAPFLFQVERTAITGPLLQFQSTLLEIDDVRKLVKSLNAALDDQALDEARVDEIFDVWWPRLKEALEAIGGEPETRPKARSEKDLLAEVLELARSQQQLLSRPEDLFPPGYVDHVLGQPPSERIEPAAVKDLKESWRQLTALARQIQDEKDKDLLLEGIERTRFPLEYVIDRLEGARRGRGRRAPDRED
jgi:hypothetical protein